MTIIARALLFLALVAAAGSAHAVAPVASLGVLERWQGRAITHSTCDGAYRSFEARTRLTPSERRAARARCRAAADRVVAESRHGGALQESP